MIITDFKSFLNEIKSNEESTDFKKWFGESKVIDENRNPLIVYHGSRELFNDFKPSFDGLWFSDSLEVSKHFSQVEGLKQKRYSKKLTDIVNFPEKYDNIDEMLIDLKQIGFKIEKVKENKNGYINWYFILTDKNGYQYKFSEYTRRMDLKNEIIKLGKNYAVFLNIEKPFIVDAKGREWDNIVLNGKIVTTKDISLMVKNSGIYDGIIIKNIYEVGIKCHVYVVYHNNQTWKIN